MSQAAARKRIVTEMPEHSQTTQCVLFGAELRELRLQAGLTQAEVAARVRTGHASICKGERGRRPFPEEVVRRMLPLYGVTARDAIEEWVQRAREARTPGWHAVHRGDAPRWFRRYLGLEQGADRKLSYETELVPGLLQIREYTQAIAAAFADPADNLVDVRAARRQRLDDPDHPLWFAAVLGEAVIRRHVGGREVMRKQLAHLADMATQPNISLRILPFAAPEHPAMTGGAFTMLEFEAPLTTVCIEHLNGATYIDRPDDVQRYRDAFEHLTYLALGEGETITMIEKVRREL